MTDVGGVFSALGTLLNDTGSAHAPGSSNSGGSGSGSLSGSLSKKLGSSN